MEEVLQLLNEAGLSTQFVVLAVFVTLVTLAAFRTNFPAFSALALVIATGVEVWKGRRIVTYFIVLIAVPILVGLPRPKKPKEDQETTS